MKKKIILTIIIFCLGISVCYATELILGSNVYYDNSSTGLNSTNVQDAIDELYFKAKNTCESVSTPNLGENNELIPVTIKDDGTVTYVSENDDNWYNYCEKKWANAVILEDNVNYKVGDTINESDIESYFVWIPKYKYKLWNIGTASKNAHEIEIIFDEENTTDIEGYSCATPMVSGESGNCDNGEYMTHPAFINFNSNGFWVGKFEVGYRGATTTATAQVNSTDASKVIIKPNVYSWRYVTLYNMFLTSYNYERELDSHMMKNTEWGAVAYLSHSKFGTNAEININNNSSYKTGSIALPSTNQQTYPGEYGDDATYNTSYNTSIGYLASTTGNITGVYDMSGGADEYMASYRGGSSGTVGITINDYDSKYFDEYSLSSATTTYEYRILGDATGEMGPFKSSTVGSGSYYINSWYSDSSNFIDSTYPWFGRGGHINGGAITGQFYFNKRAGAANSNAGFRITLTP